MNHKRAKLSIHLAHLAFMVSLAFVVLMQIAQAESSNIVESSHTSNKNIVGGIAIKVNGDPITIYEIKQIQSNHHLTKEQASEFLIAQRLKSQEIERLNIKVDDMRIDQEIEAIASQNQMTHQQFLNALYQEGIDFDTYKKQLKEQIETRELMRNVLLSSDVSNEDKMREYYNTHKDEFIAPTDVQTTRYVSKDPKLLERTIQNPSISLNGVEKTEENIKTNSLNPQIAQLFSSLKEGEFSPILDAGGGNYVSFYVQKKHGTEVMSFDQAKNYIAQKLAQTNQEQILNEYFEKIKLKAKIEYLRGV